MIPLIKTRDTKRKENFLDEIKTYNFKHVEFEVPVQIPGRVVYCPLKLLVYSSKDTIS